MKRPDRDFGKPVVLTTFRGRINPDFDQPQFMEKFDNFELILEETSHPVLYSGRNRIIVVSFPFSEGRTLDIVIKEFFTRGLKKIKTIILPSKALKAWRGGVSLMARGIPTPVPVGYLESGRNPFIKESCYLTVLEEGVDEIRHLFRQQSPKELRSLVLALARHLSHCHQKGVLHRDLSDGNILVKKNPHDDYTFFMIDTNRIRLKKRLGRLRRIKNLTRLGVPRPYQRFFLESYLAPTGLKKGAWIWYRWRKKTYTWHINLKKRLVFRREIETRDSV
jgi:serine/threonine protein kinase